MDSLLHKKASILSFGQRQRFALIRAICKPYKWLLLDEPFSHLDKANQKKVWELVINDVQSKGAGLIITSLDADAKLIDLKMVKGMSKPKFLTRILISGLRPGQLVMQVLGLLFSFVLLAIATQGTLDYQSISDASKEGIGEDIIVLSKRSKQPSFEKAELDSLKSLVSVLEVYPFKSNQVDMEMGFEGLGKAARSDYFGFECIDSDVLATDQWDWDWSFSTDSLAEVPILIPKDFLRLSSVLTSDKIPLSEDELKYFRLELMPKDSLNNPTNASFKARVVGSSDRISAVVVPCGFVDYLNSTFVRKKSLKLKPKRIAVKFDVERVIELKEYINAQGYETNESKLRSGEHAALFRGAFHSCWYVRPFCVVALPYWCATYGSTYDNKI